MAVVIDKYNEKTYTLVINSGDKVSGTHNNATFLVNWDMFLPRDITNYKVLYAFQSSGGYYSDGVTKIPSTIAGGNSLLYSTTPTAYTFVNGIVAVGATTFVLGGTTGVPANLQYVFAYSTTNSGLNCFPAGTQIIGATGATAGSTITVSNAAIYPIATSSPIYFCSSAIVNPVTYCSARILVNFNTTQYSLDTSTQSPSLNLGICQRDIQTANSKSNTLSTFYCQIPPRCLVRPSNNYLNIQIFNNAFFAGGITSYTGTTPATYSTTSVNTNYLTDTNSFGTAIASTNDMTPYNLYLEFIPIKV
jgi:hypothetical protein